MKIVSIVGARPQFIKAAVLSRAIRKENDEILVHTGQHYDDNMSEIFFRNLGIPSPEYNLGIGSGEQGAQTGAMLIKIEQVLLKENPAWVVVYGDTNSTLAGAIAAVKQHLKVAHVEAGLRSFNREMPEEVNRLITDHISSLLFCPSENAVENLKNEGIERGVYVVGDVMYEALTYALNTTSGTSEILKELHLKSKNYLLITVHRAENTDNKENILNIFRAFQQLQEEIIFPVHPRTRKAIKSLDPKYLNLKNIHLIDPLGYFEMVQLEKSARMILTDSGGVQKEAYWLGIPCVTLRNETEWIETVQNGWNMVVGTDAERIIEAVRNFSPPINRPVLYTVGDAAAICVNLLMNAN